MLISSLVSFAENKPSLFIISSHFSRASHPFLTSSWTKPININEENRVQAQWKQWNEESRVSNGVPDQPQTPSPSRGSSEISQREPAMGGPPYCIHPSVNQSNRTKTQKWDNPDSFRYFEIETMNFGNFWWRCHFEKCRDRKVLEAGRNGWLISQESSKPQPSRESWLTNGASYVSMWKGARHVHGALHTNPATSAS